MSFLNKFRKDDAVSPVVGVMLMLVVTIIIAAVVATFASGVTADTDAASNVVIKFEDLETVWVKYGGGPTNGYTFAGVVTGTPNPDNDNLGLYKLTFMHKGGEKLKIDDLHFVMTVNQATFSTPINVLTNQKEWAVGQKLTLDILEKIKNGDYNVGAVDQSTSELVLGFTKQSLYWSPNQEFDWAITDASGYVIAKGTEQV